MWHGFAQQPGTHLRWVVAGIRRLELRTTERQTIAAVRPTGLKGSMTVCVGGRSFTDNIVKIPNPGYPPSWPPGIAEIIGHPEASSHKPIRAVRARLNTLRAC